MSIGLVGDVGGTNARFALAADGVVGVSQTWKTGRVPALPHVYTTLAGALPGAPGRPDYACIAVAAPVDGPSVTLTNADLTLDVRTLGIPRARLANDLEAAAAGVPDVPAHLQHPLVPGPGHPQRPMVVVGMGTGLGVAIRLASGDLISGEGGHAQFAPSTPQLAQLVDALGASLERPVEWEDLLCGRGFGRILAWCRHNRALAVSSDFSALEATARGAAMAQDSEAYDLIVGAVADLLRGLALTVCAGSVVLCGGVAGHLREAFMRPIFAARFRAPGPVSHVLNGVGVTLLTDDALALRGCVRLNRG